MAVKYPTTRYPAARESQRDDSEEMGGAPDRSVADTGTEELTAERGRVLALSGMSAPPNSELFGPMKQ
jgi:hypothetical protein